MGSLNILIVGAGGIGGYLGAKLFKNNYDVTLLARGKQYEAIKNNGLKVLEYKEDDFTVFPRVEENISGEIFDIVFIATKSCDFESACRSIETCIDENTLIIPLSNGVEHKSVLSTYLSTGIICDGAIYIISEIEKPGVINRKSFTFYLLFGGDQEYIHLKVLEQIFNSCNLRTYYTPNIKYECWKKFLFISAMSALTTYYNQSIEHIVKNKFEEFVYLLVEIKIIANKKGIDLSDSDIEKAVKQAGHVPEESKTSMQLDFENDRKNELEALCGYIVKEANILGVNVPYMQKIYNSLAQK